MAKDDILTKMATGIENPLPKPVTANRGDILVHNFDDTLGDAETDAETQRLIQEQTDATVAEMERQAAQNVYKTNTSIPPSEAAWYERAVVWLGLADKGSDLYNKVKTGQVSYTPGDPNAKSNYGLYFGIAGVVFVGLIVVLAVTKKKK